MRLTEFRDVFHRSHGCNPFAGVLNAWVGQAVAVAIVCDDSLGGRESDGVAILHNLVHADETGRAVIRGHLNFEVADVD